MLNRNKEDHFTITIEKLVYKGLGLGTHDGFKVFIPNVIPGDTILFQYTKIKKRYGEGKCISIQTPSSQRIESPCQHYPTCGGCQLLNVSYDTQLAYKKEMLHDAIKQFYPALSPLTPEVIPSPETTFYRNKMEFSFGYDEGKLTLGLKKRGSFNDIVPIHHCLLQSDTSNTILERLRLLFEKTSLSIWNSREQVGLLRYVTVRESKAFQTQMVILSVSALEGLPIQDIIDELQKIPSITSFYIKEIKEQKGTPTSYTLHHSYGDQHLFEKLGSYTFQISPDSFFQTNTNQAVSLYDAVKNALPTSTRLLDLYCGTGTIGIYCSSTTKSLIGIEEIENAIENAKENAHKNNIDNATFHVARVKNYLKFNAISCDAIIIDPPRSGMTPKALQRTLQLESPTIVYVSCNPTTLLRDLALITEKGYNVASFEAFDMFPHTYHLECVVKLTKS